MNKKMLIFGIVLVLLASLFIAALPSVSATEYECVQLENTAYGGSPFKLSWDDFQEGSVIQWDWYAEKEGWWSVDPAYIEFWIEDGNGNIIFQMYDSEDIGERTVSTTGKYVVVWEYYDEDGWEDDYVDLYYELKVKKPPAPDPDGGSGNGDDSTPGFESVIFVAGICIAVAVILVSNKQKKRR